MYDNKKIFILGMARSGYEVAKVLASHNCDILITDKEEQDKDHIKELESLGVKYIVSNKPETLLNNEYDYVVKNPGIKIDHAVCLKADILKIPVINELEVAYHYLANNVKIIGITGSNGKTTTTTITYEILKKANLPVHLGGNIGYPMCSLIDKVKENEIIVLEISCQQLHDFKDFKTDIGVLTNLVPVHLDHFKTYENYKYHKSRIFDHHDSSNVAILNGTDEDVMDITKNIKSKKILFSSIVKNDLYIMDGYIWYNEDKIIALEDIILKGNHNYENIMCAIAIAKEFKVNNNVIKDVLKNFFGVAHRLEFVKEINHISFYNDSKATNVKSTQIALRAFTNPTILLLGGLDRKHSFDDLVIDMKHVKQVICYGETKQRIKEFCDKNNFKCQVVNTLEEATIEAYKKATGGDVILLSPACASWDQYKCFEDRGNEFKRVIEQMR
ncbi:MAG: UDP-N-acetylmuramoyl-L-alanine--D-glutamate ligase [Bacilli bacterium]